MKQLRLLPHAKLNLGLRILGRRQDGYHELVTCFQTIDLTDELEIRWVEREISLEVEGESLPSGPPNLVLRAAQSLRAGKKGLPGARLTLRKRIPVAAGLGGGSSDAAAALMGLARIWNLDLDKDELSRIAGTLGADIPFFLTGGTAIGRGRGDRITSLPDMSVESLLLVVPPFPSPTEEAFRLWDRAHPGREGDLSVDEQDEGVGAEPALTLDAKNDFEEVLVPLHPELAGYLSILRGGGALAASLSGSGPSVYGRFRSGAEVERVLAERDWGSARVFQSATVTRETYARRLGVPLSD